MKFSSLLIHAIQQSEIPLRFESGAEESVAYHVTEMIKLWVAAHEPNHDQTDFDHGQKVLITQLIDELEDKAELPEET